MTSVRDPTAKLTVRPMSAVTAGHARVDTVDVQRWVSLRKIYAARDQRELRPRVGTEAGVVTRQREVVEIESSAPRGLRDHIDDAPCTRGLERGRELLHEEHRRKVVEREGLLMSFRRDRSHGEHPRRVVDEHVEPRMARDDLLRGTSHVAHEREVGPYERRLGGACALQLRLHDRTARGVSRDDDDGRVVPREGERRGAAHAVRPARDHHSRCRHGRTSRSQRLR